MSQKENKEALIKVFGITKHDGLLTGVPMTVPGLLKKMTCNRHNCQIEISKGLPTEFADYMSEEQKSEFKALTKRKNKRS